MAEYIDREKVIAEIVGCFPVNPTSEFGKGVAVGVAMARVAVNHTPAADVRPVVRTKWREGAYAGYRCSVCKTTWDAPTNYCPNCGAWMEES